MVRYGNKGSFETLQLRLDDGTRVRITPHEVTLTPKNCKDGQKLSWTMLAEAFRVIDAGKGKLKMEGRGLTKSQVQRMIREAFDEITRPHRGDGEGED